MHSTVGPTWYLTGRRMTKVPRLYNLSFRYTPSWITWLCDFIFFVWIKVPGIRCSGGELIFVSFDMHKYCPFLFFYLTDTVPLSLVITIMIQVPRFFFTKFVTIRRACKTINNYKLQFINSSHFFFQFHGGCIRFIKLFSSAYQKFSLCQHVRNRNLFSKKIS